MPYKKKATPGTVQFHKSIAELPEKGENIKAQIQFRHDLLEFQELITRTNSIDFKVPKKLSGLDANTKPRMNELQKKARQSLNGEPSHRIYSTKF